MIFNLKIVGLFWTCLISGYYGFGQSKVHDSLIIRSTLVKNKVEQKDDLVLKVVVINASDHPLQAYKKLVEGYASDNKMNFNLVVEKDEQGKGKFELYRNRSLYQSTPTSDSVDYIPKSLLTSHDSITHFYHLDNVYMFEEGNYRVKCVYRNNILEAGIVSSTWYYFTVVKKIYVTKYYE